MLYSKRERRCSSGRHGQPLVSSDQDHQQALVADLRQAHDLLPHPDPGGCRDYTYQEGEGGIADALALAEHFADGQKICVVLGDNIIQGNVREAVEEFKQQPTGAKILLKEVPDAERFGVAEIRDGRIASIEEKPKHPKSNYAVIGIYMYDETVFEKVRVLVPSGRGELEITDVNNAYIREGSMSYGHLDGWWTDAGTFESLLRAANLVAETRTKNSEAVLVKP